MIAFLMKILNTENLKLTAKQAFQMYEMYLKINNRESKAFEERLSS